MNLSHLSDTQKQAVRSGSVDLSVTASLCGSAVVRREGECRCGTCQMPVTLDGAFWVYK